MVLANVAARPFSPSAPAEPPRDPVSIETILELDFDGLFGFSAAKFYPKAKILPQEKACRILDPKKSLGVESTGVESPPLSFRHLLFRQFE